MKPGGNFFSTFKKFCPISHTRLPLFSIPLVYSRSRYRTGSCAQPPTKNATAKTSLDGINAKTAPDRLILILSGFLDFVLFDSFVVFLKSVTFWTFWSLNFGGKMFSVARFLQIIGAFAALTSLVNAIDTITTSGRHFVNSVNGEKVCQTSQLALI